MSELTKHFLSYLMGNAFIQSLNFLVLPVIGRHFAPAEYAVIPLVEIYLMVFCWVTSAMLVSGMSRYYFDPRFNRQRLLSTVITVLVACGVVAAGFVSVFLHVTGFAPAYYYLILIATLHQVLLQLYTVPFEMFKLEQKPGAFLGCNLLKSACYLSIFWYLVVYLGHDVTALFEAQVLSSLVVLAAAWCFGSGLRQLRFIIDLSILRTLLSFSCPLIIAGIGMFLIEYSGRYFIFRYLGEEALGHFAFIYKIVNALSVLLLVPANNVWTPYIFKSLGDESRIRQSMPRAVTLMTAAAMIIILGLLSNYDFIIDLMSKGNFRTPDYVFFILAAGYLLYALLAILSPGFHIREKTFLLGRYFFYAGVVNVGLNMTLIPVWGLLGAAVTIFASFLILLLLYAINLQQVFPIIYERTKLTVLWLFFTLAGIALIAWDWRSPANNLIYACFTVACMACAWWNWVKAGLIAILRYFFNAYVVYRLVQTCQVTEPPVSCFCFRELEEKDIGLFKRFARQRTPGYFEKVAPQLSDKEQFRCLALISEQSGEIVYACWVRLQSFYAADLKRFIELGPDDAYFYDDYTLPAYRSLGLHGAMMDRRINYCIRQGRTCFYIGIQLFHRYPEKSALKRGFKRQRFILYYRRGSLASAWSRLMRAASRLLPEQNTVRQEERQ